MESKNGGQNFVNEIITQLKNNEVRNNIIKRFRYYVVKVAYYSFQKRKITFLELKFKANQSFSFGSSVAIAAKRNNINPHYPGKVI